MTTKQRGISVLTGSLALWFGGCGPEALSSTSQGDPSVEPEVESTEDEKDESPDECVPASEGCPCAGAGGELCDPGLLCDEGTCRPPEGEIDLLLILDNSAGLNVAHERIADALPAFLDPMVAAGKSVRVGVTTTDAGHPLCGNDTSPERGNLQYSSCRDRLPSFVSYDGRVDVRDAGCRDRCAYSSQELAVAPTQMLGQAISRPWFEVSSEGTNLEDPQLSLAQILPCVVPQGVSGCGFEAPLESLNLLLRRTRSEDQTSFGFIRENSTLVVLLVTNEMDCSINHAQRERWKDWGNEERPASRFCWDAGVLCRGDPSAFTTCTAHELDASGEVTTNSDEALLYPIDRYREDYLGTWREAPTYTFAILGVPEGYPDSPLSYSRAADDPELIETWGIDSTCVVDENLLVFPPVRLLPLAEESDGELFSICATDYSPYLERMAERVLDD